MRRGPDDTTFLQSIKGVSPTQLSVCALCHFCTINGINGYKDQSEVMMCNLIINRMKLKTLDKDMYPEDFSGDAGDNNGGDGQPSAEAKSKKLKKGSKPQAVTKDGTYYHVILTNFLQELHISVTGLGENPTAKQLDNSKQFLHADKYAKLAEVYNSDRNDLKTFKTFVCNHQLYADAGVPANQPSDFNKLSPLEFCQTMDYINLHYQDVKRSCTKSGSHDQFASYVGTHSYLFLYDENLKVAPLQSLARQKLPKGFGSNSLLKRTWDDDESLKNCHSKKGRIDHGGGKGKSEKA
jgi:hypothetical protein